MEANVAISRGDSGTDTIFELPHFKRFAFEGGRHWCLPRPCLSQLMIQERKTSGSVKLMNDGDEFITERKGQR